MQLKPNESHFADAHSLQTVSNDIREYNILRHFARKPRAGALWTPEALVAHKRNSRDASTCVRTHANTRDLHSHNAKHVHTICRWALCEAPLGFET